MKKIVITAMLSGIVAVSARAECLWNAASGDWSVAGNWVGDNMPTASSGGYVYIQNGGTATVTTSAATAERLLVGGQASGLSGALDVDGGTLTIGGWSTIFVGRGGSTGTMTVQNGGSVTSDRVYVGNQTSDSTGTITLDGAGSSWTTTFVDSHAFKVGEVGTGTLNILNGATVNTAASFSRVGEIAGSTGTINVIGNGSSYIQNGIMLLGKSGAGSMTIADGGLVSLNGMTIDEDGNGDGVLYMSTGGQLALDGSYTDLAGFLGKINGTDNIDLWDGTAWTDITSGGLGTDYTLTAGTGDLAGKTVLTVIPEPATLGLMVFASAGVLAMRRLRA